MKNFLKYTTLLLVMLLMASCEDFLDVNEDPNNPVVVSPDLVLPVAQVYTANVMYNNRYINNLGNMLMYNWSQSDGFAWYPDEFKYNVTSSFYAQIFNYSYSNTLKSYNVLEGLEAKYDYYKAIAKIMKAYHFQLLVDLYGDVPYSEALLRGGNATPKYDDAQTIYDDLIVQLTAAIDLIDNAVNPEEVGDGDVIFEGDMDSWKQFANTIKIRILTRQSSMASRSAYIQTEINNIVAEGSGFIAANVAVNPGYLQEVDKQNPMWETFGKDAGGTVTMNNNATCATDYVLNYLNSTNDPRLDRLYEKPATGHLGVPQGLLDYDTPVIDAYAPTLVSNIGPGILKGATMDAVILTLAEHRFNLAELVQRGFTGLTGTAQSLYEGGIQASCATLGVTTANYNTYMTTGAATNLVGWAASGNKLQAIITQKWIAVNGMNAEQSWFDYSRTGYPAGLPISQQATTANRPVRLFYPAGEYSSNGANVPTQPDAFTAKIFWAN
jgi:hypothetical protein